MVIEGSDRHQPVSVLFYWRRRLKKNSCISIGDFNMALPNTSTQSRLIDLNDTISKTGYGRSSVYKLISSGELTPVRVGIRKLLFSEQEVNAWVEKQLAKNWGAK
jgi:excisionase family DNA binding protein